jgi:WD40 repeat protein
MPRPQRPVDPSEGPVQRLAVDLRELRARAGNPGYREMARWAGYSVTALSDAAGGRQLPGLALTLAYVEACGGDARDWEVRWRECAAEVAAQRSPAGPSDPSTSPYLGLACYEAGDAARFFGREALVAQVCSQLAANRLVTVFGPSGGGKSSLLRAGVVPAFKGSSGVITPGAQPCRELAAFEAARPDLVVVDQFEEVFALCTDLAERERFVNALLDLAEAPGGPRVVLGIRADFFAACAQLPRLARSMAGSTVLVGQMAEDEMVQAVTGPARQAGLTVERALLAQVLAETRGQPGALPLLSHALLEIWRQRRSNVLTLAGYEAAGGISGAIARTADQVYEHFGPSQRAATRQILTRLTALGEGTADTRRRVDREELDFPGADDVIAELAAARLIVVQDSMVEIAHEALIESWPRLHRWLTEDRDGLRLHRQLTDTARQWAALGQDQGTLYRGTRLALTTEGVRRAVLTPLESRFLAVSQAAERAERAVAERRTRLLRVLAAALAAALVCVLVAAVVAVTQWQGAARQAREATSRQLAAQALRIAPADVPGGLRLGLEAYGTAPTADARSALLSLASRHAYSGRLQLTQPPKDLAFTGDGALLASAGQDGRIVVWDVAHRTERAQLTGGHRGAVRTIAVSGNLLVSGGLDGTVVLWDLDSGTVRQRLQGGWSRVNSVAFSPDGQILAAAGEGAGVRLWRVRDGKLLGVLPAGGTRSDVAFGPDGRWLVTVGAGREAVRWDVARLRRIAALPLAADPYAIAISADGRRIAIGGDETDIQMWNQDGTVTVLHGHTGYVRSLAFTPDGTQLISGGYDEFAIVWDVARARPVTRLTGHASELYAVAASPDGRTVATGSRDSSVLLFDRDSQPMTGPVDNITAVSVSPDGRRVAASSRDTTASVWDTSTRARVAMLAGHGQRVADVRFSPTGRLIATAGDDRTIRLWDATAFTLTRTLTGHTGEVTSLAFRPDGAVLASGGADMTVRLWDVATGRQLRPSLRLPEVAVRVVFAANGQTLVATARDGTILIENLATGTERRLHNPVPIAESALRSDGTVLAVGDNDGGIRLWRLAAGTSTELPRIHEGTVSALAFSPDGTRLASGSMDAFVLVWTVDLARLWATLSGHQFDVLGLSWSPDGRALYSGASDRTVTRWIVETGDAVAAVCADLADGFPGTPAASCPDRVGAGLSRSTANLAGSYSPGPAQLSLESSVGPYHAVSMSSCSGMDQSSASCSGTSLTNPMALRCSMTSASTMTVSPARWAVPSRSVQSCVSRTDSMAPSFILRERRCDG